MKKAISAVMVFLTSCFTALRAFAEQTPDSSEILEDGINTNVATVWIICISAVVASVIIAITVILAKRNRNN